MFLKELRPALVVFAALTLVTGVLYPLVVTGIARAAFPAKSRGSIVERDGKAVGSSLIAQPFDAPQYFWPRPSGAAYNAAASSGTNLGPTNPALVDVVRERVEKLGDLDGKPVPADLVTASGSGLDPHLSPAAAEAQVARVAAARNLSPDAVRAAVARHTDPRTFGLLGEPRVNVLMLNLDLDGMPQSAAAPMPTPTRWPMTVPPTTIASQDAP